jgi:hypothetical protein
VQTQFGAVVADGLHVIGNDGADAAGIAAFYVTHQLTVFLVQSGLMSKAQAIDMYKTAAKDQQRQWTKHGLRTMSGHLTYWNGWLPPSKNNSHRVFGYTVLNWRDVGFRSKMKLLGAAHDPGGRMYLA